MVDVTVILTTFRRPAMLRRAILSVINQRFDAITPKVQLIVSDDSIDQYSETLACMSALEELHNVQLVYLRRASYESNGVALSRNRALSMAIGGWVVFLDDDDELEPTAISRIVSVSNRQDADLIYGGYSTVHENELGEVQSVEYALTSNLTYDHLLLSNYFPIGSFAIKKASLTRFFDPVLSTHEDWLFLLDNLKGKSLVSIGERLVKVHKRGEHGGHRNDFGGGRQKLRDYLEIYRRHPAEHLQTIRLGILKGLAYNIMEADGSPSCDLRHDLSA